MTFDNAFSSAISFVLWDTGVAAILALFVAIAGWFGPLHRVGGRYPSWTGWLAGNWPQTKWFLPGWRKQPFTEFGMGYFRTPNTTLSK
jgi:hypothetical protein